MAVDQQTLDWINQQKAQGKTDEEIKSALAASGWQESHVKEAFTALTNPSLTQTPPPPLSIGHYAGFWVRVAALLIDSLVISIPLAAITFIISLIIPKSFNNIVSTAGFLFYWFIWLFLVAKHGATPGKMLLDISIVNRGGGLPGWKIAIIREILGKLLDILTLGVGLLMIAFTKEKQGLHDKIAGTHVIFTHTLSTGKKIIIGILLFVVFVLPFIFMALGGFALFNLFKGLSGETKFEVSGPNVQVTSNSDLAKEYVTTASGKVMDFKIKNGKFPDPFEFGDLVEKPFGLFLTAYYPGEKASISAKTTENEPGWCWNSEDNQVKVCR